MCLHDDDRCPLMQVSLRQVRSASDGAVHARTAVLTKRISCRRRGPGEEGRGEDAACKGHAVIEAGERAHHG